MEMPGSAPGGGRGRWQYCPMRTRTLCGLTLLVVIAHLAAWQLAGLGLPRFALQRAGIQWIALLPVPQHAHAGPAYETAPPGAGRKAITGAFEGALPERQLAAAVPAAPPRSPRGPSGSRRLP